MFEQGTRVAKGINFLEVTVNTYSTGELKAVILRLVASWAPLNSYQLGEGQTIQDNRIEQQSVKKRTSIGENSVLNSSVG